MNELESIKETMSSLEVAELTGKQHAHVMRDIRSLLEQGVSESNFGLSSYKQAQPNGGSKEVPCYNLTKKGCLILASGYDALLREKIINRWEELETAARTSFPVPQSFSEALMLAARQQEKIEQQQKALRDSANQIVTLSAAITEMQPKVTYVDKILENKATVTITQIAQDYGMSAIAFNRKLAELHIQRKVNGQWILLHPHTVMGYVHSNTLDIGKNGASKVVMNTEWTQKGRMFLYETLKKTGIIPLIER